MYAQYELPLLICGEPGTEKTRLAECIHNESLRRDKQFIQADVSTLPIANQTELLLGARRATGLYTMRTRERCTCGMWICSRPKASISC